MSFFNQANQASAPGLSSTLAWLLCVVLTAAWIGAHKIRPPSKAPWTARSLVAVRVLLGFGAGWFLLEALRHLLLFNSGWPDWVVALIGASTVEVIIALYSLERRSVHPLAGTSLLVLRLLLALFVLGMLLEPVFTFEAAARHERFIAVLLDDSASMQLTDPQSTAGEKLQLARFFGIALSGPAHHLDEVVPQVAELRREFDNHVNSLSVLASLDTEAAAAQLSRRRDALVKMLDKARQVGDLQGKIIGEAIERGPKVDPKTLQALQEARTRLQSLLDGGMTPLRKILETGPAPPAATVLAPLRDQLQLASSGIKQLEEQLQPLPALLDESLLASLPPAEGGRINQLAEESRQTIAREVLLSTQGGQAALVDEIGKSYTLRLYRFASRPEASDLKQWRAQPPTEGAPGTGDSAGAPSRAADWRQATDFAAALQQVQQDIPVDQLSGVIVLSDGRHNHGAPLEPLARQFSIAHVPICSVMIGSKVAPRDAAIANVERPETVFAGDKMTMNTTIKATGFRGEKLSVKLLYNGQAVDEKTLAIPEDAYQTTVALSHRQANVGIHQYRIELQTPAGDVLDANNHRDVQIAVTDSRIKLLIVDNRPRWEFRYLKNLFAGRDKTVQLQYVLLNPDHIAGAPERPRIPASVARPYGEFEATALPETPDEWLKFEVIVLGDLPPETLDPPIQAALKKFVGERGGALVVIAGSNSMPHAYAGSALAELLPVTIEPGVSPAQAPEPAYRLALTPEGLTHMIMKQRASPADSAAVWKALPLLDWRHAVQQVKPGASVLAYAEPPDFHGAGADGGTDLDRVRLQTQNALVVVHKYGAGNVLLLNFDRTWRLRYRVGDTYHHRFWEQVLRWATTDKLSAGTAHVRLGTDQLRYQADQSVVVRAQVLDEQANPVISDEVSARVYQNDKLVLTRALAPVPDSRGLYQADLGALSSTGSYRVELVGRPVAKLLALDKAEKLQADFLVASIEATSELVDLNADWTIPRQLAGATGGRVVGPADARGLLDLFGTGSTTVREMRSLSLWDSWPFLLVLLLVVCAEWIVRKKAGLI